MAMTITNHPGGAITRKFDSLEEMQAWAKEHITNKQVLDAVMSPVTTKRVSSKTLPPSPVEGKKDGERDLKNVSSM